MSVTTLRARPSQEIPNVIVTIGQSKTEDGV